MIKMIDQRIENEMEKLEQLERRKRLQDSKKRKVKQKNDERRMFIVGKILLDIFPEFLKLHPQKSIEENEREFSPLKDFLSVLAADKDLVNRLKAKAVMISSANNIYKDSK